MYSLRYGTIPIVRNTGGLADSVEHFDPVNGTGTGCIFNDYDAPAARWAIETVFEWYGDAQRWQQLVRNAMAKDFSWSRQINDYDSLYRSMLSAD
jgi:starch synthase